MKIIFLNVLDAEITAPLHAFLLAHRADTDVFCFQESYTGMQALIDALLPDFAQITASKPISHGDIFTNATLVRNTLALEASHTNTDSAETGIYLFTTIRYKNAEIHLANVHGLSRPGKGDNEHRLLQSKEIIGAFAPLEGIKIVGGDLNVLPETESVALFEKAGYKNLIQEYGIATTRNEIAWAKYPGNELYFSDYVFTQGATVASFEVPSDIISDHQPMILTVNL